MESVIGACGHSFPAPGPCRCSKESSRPRKPKYRRGDVLHSKPGTGQEKRLIIEMVGTESYFIRHLTGHNWAEPEESAWGFQGLEAAMDLEFHHDLPELEGFLHPETVQRVLEALEAHMEESPEEGTLAMLEVVRRLQGPGHG